MPPTIAIKENEIAALIAQAESDLQPPVRHIFWSVDQDWTGDWGLFLRIVLSDASAKRSHLDRISRQVRQYVLTTLQPEKLGLIPYISFRSESEQAALREKAWA